MRRAGPVAVLVLTALAPAAACERTGPAPDAAGFSVADSSGVAIATNRPPLGDVPEVHLDGEPLLRLGSEQEGAPDLFGRIESAHLDGEGNLWVVEAQSAELRVFALPSGRHLFTAGGRGEGPGEFQAPRPVGFEDGRAWVWDRHLARLTELGPGGEVVSVRAIGRDRELMPRLLHRTPRGTFLGQLPQHYEGEVRDGMELQDTVRIWALPGGVGESEAQPGGLSVDPRESQLLVERPGVTWYLAEQRVAAVPFTSRTQYAFAGDMVVLTDPGGAAALDVLEGGELRRRIRVERPPRRATEREVFREIERPRWGAAEADLLRRHLSEVSIPGVVPPWEWLRLAPDGHVFALEHGTLFAGEGWDVFDPEGRLAGRLSLPGEAHLAAVGSGYLVVLEALELAGPRLAVHAFEPWRGAGAAEERR